MPRPSRLTVIAFLSLLAAGSAMAQSAEPGTGVAPPAAAIAEGIPAAPSLPGTDPSPSLPAGGDPVGQPHEPAGAPGPAAGVGDEGLAPAPGGAAGVIPSGLPRDLSPLGMFRAADRVVKGVMIVLAVASLLTWTVFVAKSFEIWLAARRAGRTLRAILRAPTLQEAQAATRGCGGPAAYMVRAGAEEYALSHAAVKTAGAAGLKERVASLLARAESQAGRRLARGTGILATTGAVAPFVGLSGTVWGIMNSFIGISEAQTTNLAVVAPGIAEALLATAMGLAAAIPAVIFYNLFARRVAGYRQLLADAAAGVERLVSRDLDFRAPPAPARALAAE